MILSIPKNRANEMRKKQEKQRNNETNNKQKKREQGLVG
jgi:hypothetical protein